MGIVAFSISISSSTLTVFLRGDLRVVTLTVVTAVLLGVVSGVSLSRLRLLARLTKLFVVNETSDVADERDASSAASAEGLFFRGVETVAEAEKAARDDLVWRL